MLSRRGIAMSEMIKDQEILSEHENAGRRRLVRGVVAFAPLVLTLRSGAAAASCTGAKTVSTVLDSQARPLVTVGAVQGDVCYKTTEVQTCANSPTTKLENPSGAPTPYPIGSNGKCGNLAGGTQVAILSSTAATSFLR
jgi:hypothetical protein